MEQCSAQKIKEENKDKIAEEREKRNRLMIRKNKIELITIEQL